MNLPYAMQLAYGWTKLGLYSNVVAVVALVPLIFFMALHYGAVGAATVWIVLNSGYVLISLQIMHRRLLKGEQWRWYAIDVGLPLTAALIVAGLGRWVIEYPLSKSMGLISLAGLAILALFVSAMAAPQVRAWILQQLMYRRTTYGV